MKLNRYDVLYVDVDGTLLRWPGLKPGRVPRPGEPGHGARPTVNAELVAALKEWHRAGRTLVVWSHGGAEHARMAANLCGLSPAACLPKPRAAIDDAPDRVAQFDVLRPPT